MQKTKEYGLNGFLIGAVGKGLANALQQMKRMKQNPGIEFNWSDLWTEAGEGGLFGGLIGAGAGAYRDYRNTLTAPVNTDPLLFATLYRVKLRAEDEGYVVLRNRAEMLIDLFKQEFENRLKREPIKIGSTERGTALRKKFDIDIGLFFLPNSFPSTEKMYSAVHNYASSLIGKHSIINIRAQSKSIGILFKIIGKEFKIDIVPCRITKGKGRSNSGYLYVNKDSLLVDNSSYTKTNMSLLKKQKLSSAQKNIIILLKHWKHNNDLPLSSHLLENLVVDAYKYNYGEIPRDLTGKIVMVMKHISENLDLAYIRSVENTNNILTDIPDEDKTKIISACLAVIEDYKYQPNSIVNSINQ